MGNRLRLPKLNVEGSNPFARSNKLARGKELRASEVEPPERSLPEWLFSGCLVRLRSTTLVGTWAAADPLHGAQKTAPPPERIWTSDFEPLRPDPKTSRAP